MAIVTNSPKVRASIRKTRHEYQTRAGALAATIGRDMQRNIRANIAKPVFPGYAITGALASKVVVSPVSRVPAGWQVVVKVDRTGRQKLYALIHEVGGIIKARRAPYLVFHIPGVGWRRVKQVKIRSKRYFRRGVIKTGQTWTRARLLAALRRR